MATANIGFVHFQINPAAAGTAESLKCGSLAGVITLLALQSLGTGVVCRSHTGLGMAVGLQAAAKEQSEKRVFEISHLLHLNLKAVAKLDILSCTHTQTRTHTQTNTHPGQMQ